MALKTRVIVDTGPLVALLNRSDNHHSWVVQQLADIQPPMLTCEAVLTEASYLTRAAPGARAALIEMVGENFLSIGIALADHHSALLALVRPTPACRCPWPMHAWCALQRSIHKASY